MTTNRHRLAASLLALLVASPAVAGPRKVLVLPLEGTADAAARTRVSALVGRLAKAIGGQSGDTTFGDTAAAVGCDPAAPACKDEVLSTLSVDELVYGTVDLAGSDIKVTVRRGAKGSAPREASVIVADHDPVDPKLEPALDPLFGITPRPVAPTPPITKPVGPVTTGPTTKPAGTGAIAATTPTTKPDGGATTPIADGHPATGTNTGTTTPGDSTGSAGSGTPDTLPPGSHDQITDPLAAPAPGPAPMVPQPSDDGTGHHRLLVAGAAGGGAIFTVGLILWAEKNSTQGDINSAPTRTLADLQNLASLEDRASSYATWGNIMVVSGLALGGVSAYLLYREHQEHRDGRHAAITPAIFPHGGGVTLTIGGL